MNGLSQYRNYQLDTAGLEDSIPLLYDGARRFVDQAQVALEAGDYFQVSQNTGKAQRILSELAASLNMDAGGIAANLYQLYDYWVWRLGQGLIQKNPDAFREVSAALGDMRDAWADAARQVRAQRSLRAHG